MHKCTYCGGIKFETWLGYAAHMQMFHRQTMVQPIQPIKTSKRSHAEIVDTMEGFFRETTPSLLLGYGEEAKALNNALDRILASQEVYSNGNA